MKAGPQLLCSREEYAPRPEAARMARDFMPNATWTLKTGMVFHMLLSTEGIGHSEMVLVTDDGHEVLTHLDRRLFVK